MKIAIKTLTPRNNHGGILQCYAMQRVLQNMGHDSDIVTYNVNNMFPFIFSHLKRNIIAIQNIKQTDYDAICIGSDQIWRRGWMSIEEAFCLFAYDWPIKKFSYAASMGVPNWEYTNEETVSIIQQLKTFTGVSCRENDLCRMLQDRGVENACTMSDPTTLLPKEHYEHICQNVARKSGFFSYFLGDTGDNTCPTIKYGSLFKKIRQVSGLDSIVINQEDTLSWISAFRDAEFCITDSYHGCIFSIIFKKPFIAIVNKSRGSSRLKTLVENYNLNDRIFEDIYKVNFEVLYKPLNISNELKIWQDKGFKFLENCLEG
jgi:hypothetical protein